MSQGSRVGACVSLACAALLATFGAGAAAEPIKIAVFDFELEDPVLKRTIKHGYDVVTLPVRG